MDLSNRAVSYCNGNPLAIEVLGGTLCGMDKKYWVDFLRNLTHRQGLTGVHDILMKSYYKLVENQQRVFLNVACFLYGMLESRVIQCMEVDDYRPRCDVKDLINKSLLVSVASNDGVVIEVHDLLKDVAWIIVNKERDLNKRIMLEDALNINKVLQTTVEQDRATQGISLNLLQAKNMNLEANAFSGMKYLEWLKFYHPQLRDGRLSKINIRSGNIDLPSELKVLQWDKYPLVSQPSGIAPQNLRILCLRNSSIVKCWEGKCQLVKLVELDLSGCIDLTVIPDLSKSPHLEVLIFHKCKSLIELPSYVGNLEKLVRLNVADCVQLCSIPTQLNSKVLKYVLMSKCEKLTYCPEISNSTKLEVLDLENTPICEPPPTSTYKRVQNGGTLRLNCQKITSFPTLSSTLSELSLCNTSIREIDFPPPHSPGFESLTQPRFQRLDLNDNLLLKSLPDNIWEMVSTNIFVRNCPLLETLPNISGSVQNGLTRLVVTGCKCLKWVPSSISNLKHLQVLIFAGLAITALPPSIGELGQLSSLELTNCGSLESIPDTIYDLAKLLLQNLPRNIEELSCKEIWLDCCSRLDNGSTGNMLTNVLDQSIDLHAEGNILYPGSKLPMRLHYKSEEGKIVKVKLPCASARQQLKGFLFGAVTLCSRSGIQHLRCFCQIKLADGSTVYFGSWGSSVLVSVDRVSLNHVHIWFTNQLGRPLKNQTEDDDDDEDKEEEEETEEVWYVEYAGLTVSFIFYSVNDNKFMDIKRCGVTLLY
ncbi:Disease resistance protein RPV1 [Linum perenne]